LPRLRRRPEPPPQDGQPGAVRRPILSAPDLGSPRHPPGGRESPAVGGRGAARPADRVPGAGAALLPGRRGAGLADLGFDAAVAGPSRRDPRRAPGRLPTAGRAAPPGPPRGRGRAARRAARPPPPPPTPALSSPPPPPPP